METTRIIAIDPGVDGAIACVSRTGTQIVGAQVWDLPTWKHSICQRQACETWIDCEALRDLIMAAGDVSLILIERVIWVTQTRTGVTRDSPQSLMTSYINYGRLSAVCPGHAEVEPSVWKRQVGVTKDKRTSLALASAMYPSLAQTHLWRLKDHNRAEALLLADYAYWHVGLERMHQ